MEGILDEIDASIIRALQEDARQSYRALARRIGLSTPATAERVRRLENAGVIRGYAAQVNRAALGREVTAFLQIACPGSRVQALKAAATQSDAVLEFHQMTAEASVLLKVGAPDLRELDRIAERFRLIAPTSVSIVLSTSIEDGRPT